MVNSKLQSLTFQIHKSAKFLILKILILYLTIICFFVVPPAVVHREKLHVVCVGSCGKRTAHD